MADTTKKNVLIIEDERPLAKVLEVKLGKAGINAKSAFNGEEGLKALRAEPFDLILLDLMMPVVDGWTVLQKMKEENIGGKVIVISNLSQEQDMEKAKQQGAVAFLVKSNQSLNQITDAIQKALEG